MTRTGSPSMWLPLKQSMLLEELWPIPKFCSTGLHSLFQSPFRLRQSHSKILIFLLKLRVCKFNFLLLIVLCAKGRRFESRLFLFLLFVSFPNQSREEAFVTRRNVRVRKWPATKRDGERGGGEKKKKKNRQANQEWLRELVRFVSKTIKWSNAKQGMTWREKIIMCSWCNM